jgi:hypothetical protein
MGNNPDGVGGYTSGTSGNPNGRPRSTSAVQLYALGRCREAIDVATRVMRQPRDGDNVRLRACELILDRGVGRPNQAVALDVTLGKSLETMTLDELREFRAKYAAVVTASPALIDHVVASENADDLELPLEGPDDAD